MPKKKLGYSILRKPGPNFYVKVSATRNGISSSYSVGKIDSTLPEEEIQRKAKEIYCGWKAENGGNRATVIFDAEKDSDFRVVHLGRIYIAKYLRELGIIDKLGNLKGEKKGKYQFDLPGIVETLIESQILTPGSKRHSFLADPKGGMSFYDGTELQHVYRALDVLAKHSDEINAYSYKRIKRLTKHNTKVYYYDCMNFYYSQRSEGELLGIKKAKEGMVAPLVQMGLLIDEMGYLIGMIIFNGRESEQPSLQAQIESIDPHVSMDSVVICTDAGLCSFKNKKLLSVNGRAYITTQPVMGTRAPDLIKDYVTNDVPMSFGEKSEMKVSELKSLYNEAVESNDAGKMTELCSRTLFKDSWFELSVVKRTATKGKGKNRKWSEAPADLEKDDISETDENTEYEIRYKRKTEDAGHDPKGKDCFYSRLLVSFSMKYFLSEMAELQDKREKIRKLAKSKTKLDGLPKELRGYAKLDKATKEGEVAEIQVISEDEEAFAEAERFAGYYVQATNLGNPSQELYATSRMRWQIEYCFRTMKSNIDARPIYLTTADHVKGHFTVVFLALQTIRYMMYRMYAAEGNKDVVLGRAENSIVTADAFLEELRSMKGNVYHALEGFDFVVGANINNMTKLMTKAFGKSLTKQCLRIDDLEKYSGMKLR